MARGDLSQFLWEKHRLWLRPLDSTSSLLLGSGFYRTIAEHLKTQLNNAQVRGNLGSNGCGHRSGVLTWDWVKIPGRESG